MLIPLIRQNIFKINGCVYKTQVITHLESKAQALIFFKHNEQQFSSLDVYDEAVSSFSQKNIHDIN